jgi:aspartate carbamoyltransferase catalytic subunit
MPLIELSAWRGGGGDGPGQPTQHSQCVTAHRSRNLHVWCLSVLIACAAAAAAAGDGPGQHPTQALLDVYSIKKEIGRLDVSLPCVFWL